MSRHSTALIFASYVLTKLGDALTSPKTTLAFAVSSVGAPPWVLGFLVPVRESGSMIPQLFVGSRIRTLAVRKWVWVAGSVGQCLCVAGLGATVLLLTGSQAGWAMLGLVALFSLFRCVSSVAAKDVLGKVVPKDRRGRLTGWSASVAGLISVGIGVALMARLFGNLETPALGALILGAGVLWLLAALVYAQVSEPAGETGGGRGALEALKSLSLLVRDKPFRRFVTTRALLMCSALSAPFYVALAQSQAGGRPASYLLGAFVTAAGVAGLISGPVWGRMADHSSRNTMIASAWLTSVVGLLTFVVHEFVPLFSGQTWFLPAMYFLLCVAHSGVRVGRKTYVVNLASGNQRTDYVAISNTTIGVLLLVVGSVGALTPWIGSAGVIGLLALMGVGGALLGRTLPDR